MNRENNIHRIKKRLMIEVAQLTMQDQLADQVDRIPINMHPRHSEAARCCVYKSRAVVRYRLMAILGHAVEAETDELTRLSEYAQQAQNRTRIDGPILTVIDEACSACTKGRHHITNVCKGCVARPCTVTCPKQAIQIIDGKARIEEDKCVNCGLCLKVCPYHAIVYVPIPCEEACPVGAISKDDTGREQIDYDKCIYCGKCMQACPFAAIMECSQIVDVIVQLKGPKRTVAMLAPAIAGQFPVEFEKLIAAVKEMGFDEVVEVAAGADMTAIHEAAELDKKLKAGQPFMTTSCCPAYVEAVKKHLPEMVPYVSDTPTPMQYTAEVVKANDPDCIAVFIGPCVAKRQEALEDERLDYVLTTDELGAMLVASEIELAECLPDELTASVTSQARNFAISGGVTEAVNTVSRFGHEIYPKMVDGLDKKSLKLLSLIAQKGICQENFIEVMSCQGGCVAGPCNIDNPRLAAKRIQQFVQKQEKEEAKTI